jgi:ABC-type branched-subunit amino acid transport system ATPase component
VTSTETNYWLQLVFGAGAVLVAVVPDEKREAPAALRRALDAGFRRRPEPPAPPESEPRRPTPTRIRPGALEVQGLTVRFGGLVAVDGVSLTAPTGRITGLIGPNGAGKTTTFDACSGLKRPTAGRVLLDGRDVSRTGPSARARRGLGRTFQRVQLHESLSVWDNVAFGREGVLAGGNPLSHVVTRPGDKGLVADATARALSVCGLTELAGAPVRTLGTGAQRLVELGRCLAGPFRILLLDEPSSGLDANETRRFAEILLRVVEERGVGVLLVEHDMSLVMDVCDAVHVLDFGRLIFSGTPAEVRASPVVRAAYLGGVANEAALVEGGTP